MPSQNLPKPNLPGQLQSSAPVAPPSTPVVPQAPAASANPSSSQESGAQTVFSSKPPQINQSQSIPAGLSRENPGGTPPNMMVKAPDGSFAKANAPLGQMPNASNSQAPLPIRPASPLGQPGAVGQVSKPTASPLSMAPAGASSQVSQTAPTSKPLGLTQVSQTQAMSSTPVIGQETTVAQSRASLGVSQSNSSKPIIEASVNTSEAPPTEAKGSGIFNKIKAKLPLPVLIALALLVVGLIGVLVFNLLKPKTSTTTRTPQGSQTNNTSTGANTTGNSGQITTLTYWGLWEDSQILKEVIAEFESKNPNIKIDYRKQSHRDYRERLQQAIASGSGPDIFRYHVAWVPMLATDLSGLPSSVMSMAEYKQTFYPTAYNNLQSGGQIVGIPLMYDGLALLYNKEMLKTANLDVPSTWAELRTAANKLTVPSNISERSTGNITRSGLAIGNAGNVDHFSDILALLIIQNGGNPADVTSQYVKDALTFYTNFIKQDKIWSERLANSTTAFARGDVAMIFAPSWRIHDIKNLNPDLDFGVARTPQLDADNPMAWATFWAEGVSAKSSNKEAAWAFLKHMSTPEVLRKFYTDASQFRTFGEIYPRIDMASELQNDELVGAYIADAPLAKTWYMSSFTHDNGLNDQVIKYYEDAVTTALTSSSVEKALETASTGITTVLGKYNFK